MQTQYNSYSTANSVTMLPALLKCIGFLSLCFLSMPSEAKKLYKYQDEKGGWHYTDKAPPAKQSKEFKVEVRQLKVASKQRVRLNKIGEKQQPEFTIRNDYFGPIQVEVVFSEHKNVQAAPSLPRKFVVPPGVSKPLFSLGAIDQFQGWRYALSYRYSLGEPTARHNSQAIYYPPFASYRKFQISQSFNGKFSHTDKQNKYAVDLSMPEGSEVHAARAGVVMSLENDFFKGGIDKQAYKARANSVRILHDDGSMAVYAHLQVDRAQVYAGMRVEAGQLIAYSGNTGFSSGPHLHFSVQVNQGMNLVSVPFGFSNSQGKVSQPKAGQWLSGFVTLEKSVAHGF
ncbi:peptidoglycan DD-metalloendopeptidase family protein [Methyloprofundus sp.]|uniref:peptidoglycan DD-metalloendopeptidase family protein n=1 Tax=Methyloprofundus sp. TaxID=2020875 RepID=UPI003D14779E